MLREQGAFRQRVAQLLADRYAHQDPPVHVEQRIYDGFPTHADEARMIEFHQCEWCRRANIVVSLEDDRFRELGQRIVASECPDMLSDTQRRHWLTWRRDRLLGEGDLPWLTVAAARAEIVALREDANGEQLRQLAEIDQFFVEKVEMLKC